jgi:hypothetical protein
VSSFEDHAKLDEEAAFSRTGEEKAVSAEHDPARREPASPEHAAQDDYARSTGAAEGDYSGPDPESDEKGDRSSEDQGT